MGDCGLGVTPVVDVSVRLEGVILVVVDVGRRTSTSDMVRVGVQNPSRGGGGEVEGSRQQVATHCTTHS